jgi:hypothetical protein
MHMTGKNLVLAPKVCMTFIEVEQRDMGHVKGTAAAVSI